MAPRDYGQWCGITRALELVGERRTAEGREGVAAFREKRRPKFQGR